MDSNHFLKICEIFTQNDIGEQFDYESPKCYYKDA